jgi:CheY-like chemotaxis protein
VDLNALVSEMIQLLAHTTLKRVELLTELEAPLSPVLGDAGALSHALMNLCVNALDAMPGGGTLLIRTENLAGAAVRLTVKDTGTGMTPEVWSKAVEPFYTTKPLGKGTGLGLAMVFGTMKAHGGELQIHSRVGDGTAVQLTFPAAAAAAAPSGEPGRGGPATAEGALSILLVDDDELIQDSVGPMLEMLGHTAAIAGSGAAALARLEGGLEVDLVILDMNMPGLDGGETLVRILERWPEQSVLMASGYSETEIQALIRDRPGVGFIQKPFRMAEIKRKLAAMNLAPRGPLGSGPVLTVPN